MAASRSPISQPRVVVIPAPLDMPVEERRSGSMHSSAERSSSRAERKPTSSAPSSEGSDGRPVTAGSAPKLTPLDPKKLQSGRPPKSWPLVAAGPVAGMVSGAPSGETTT